MKRLKRYLTTVPFSETGEIVFVGKVDQLEEGKHEPRNFGDG